MLKGLDGRLLRILMFILAKQSEIEGMSCRYYELRVIDLATVQLENTISSEHKHASSWSGSGL